MSRRSLVPMSSFEDKFISISELDLTKIFWQDDALQYQLRMYAQADFPSAEYIEQISQPDIGMWVSRKGPGHLITKLITDIGGYTPGERKRLKDYRRSTLVMPLDKIREHIEAIRDDTFDPNTYKESGYVLRGSIRTDGFRLQLLAFKLNELNAVKYRRLPADKLPPRITSTLGGTDYYLTEIRNVVKTKQDVSDLWGCDPNQIKILGLDLGQAFVIGASALLPNRELSTMDRGKRVDSAVVKSSPSDTERTGGIAVAEKSSPSDTERTGGIAVAEKSSPSDTERTGGIAVAEKSSTKFYNLAVKQKAVYQPTLKYRRWMEQRKSVPLDDSRSISSIESNLPHLRGSAASIADYVDKLQDVETHLDSFYGNVVLKKHKWNAGKARDEEYKQIASRLLKQVGGSLGARRDDSNKVVIGVGLGQFSTKTRLSSLHESFQSYFVQKVSGQ